MGGFLVEGDVEGRIEGEDVAGPYFIPRSTEGYRTLIRELRGRLPR